MWEEGRKMDDPSVFTEIFAGAGLDGEAMLLRTQDTAAYAGYCCIRRILLHTQDAGVKAEQVQNTAETVDRDVFGAPSFFVGRAMFVWKRKARSG